MFQLRCFLDILSKRLANQVVNNRCYLNCKKRRHSVTNLYVLRCPVSAKEIVVWKGLKPRRLSNRQAPALQGIGVYVVVSVLRYVRRDCGGRPVGELYAEPVGEILAAGHSQGDVGMFWQESLGKVHQLRRPPVDPGE